MENEVLGGLGNLNKSETGQIQYVFSMLDLIELITLSGG